MSVAAWIAKENKHAAVESTKDGCGGAYSMRTLGADC